MMRIVSTGLCLGIALLGTSAGAAEMISGRPAVIDGDTLRVHGQVVGLFGIAAPGPGQTCEKADGKSAPCGADASRALAQHIGTASVRCEARRIDGHHRKIAVCRLGNEDLAAWLVEKGLAVADRFETAEYKPLEKKAWAKRKGLWAGVFEDPTERKREDYPAKQASALAE